jgi:hypothetical protein
VSVYNYWFTAAAGRAAGRAASEGAGSAASGVAGGMEKKLTAGKMRSAACSEAETDASR